ncbi:Proteolipid membrane potential modulator [Symmachiella macrocystis]|uniref:Proteolipid membrane potential modulator n=1 Tax=Symmachiella macrocystis TaxID=2527985 RepID=A0A5C6BTI8_9PLAN|nr:Proteolipid membrane potential modulator [Symmachiella macrocystis]
MSNQVSPVSHDAKSPSADIVRILLAILLPPVGVFLQVGFGMHFWLNILLTILGYVPGIIHAVWVIVRK